MLDRLGDSAGCSALISKSYAVISHAWLDFDANHAGYMEAFWKDFNELCLERYKDNVK